MSVETLVSLVDTHLTPKIETALQKLRAQKEIDAPILAFEKALIELQELIKQCKDVYNNGLSIENVTTLYSLIKSWRLPNIIENDLELEFHQDYLAFWHLVKNDIAFPFLSEWILKPAYWTLSVNPAEDVKKPIKNIEIKIIIFEEKEKLIKIENDYKDSAIKQQLEPFYSMLGMYNNSETNHETKLALIEQFKDSAAQTPESFTTIQQIIEKSKQDLRIKIDYYEQKTTDPYPLMLDASKKLMAYFEAEEKKWPQFKQDLDTLLAAQATDTQSVITTTTTVTAVAPTKEPEFKNQIDLLFHLVETELMPEIQKALSSTIDKKSQFYTFLSGLEKLIPLGKGICNNPSTIVANLSPLWSEINQWQLPTEIKNDFELNFYQNYLQFVKKIRNHKSFPFSQFNSFNFEWMNTTLNSAISAALSAANMVPDKKVNEHITEMTNPVITYLENNYNHSKTRQSLVIMHHDFNHKPNGMDNYDTLIEEIQKIIVELTLNLQTNFSENEKAIALLAYLTTEQAKWKKLKEDIEAALAAQKNVSVVDDPHDNASNTVAVVPRVITTATSTATTELHEDINKLITKAQEYERDGRFVLASVLFTIAGLALIALTIIEFMPLAAAGGSAILFDLTAKTLSLIAWYAAGTLTTGAGACFAYYSKRPVAAVTPSVIPPLDTTMTNNA